MSVEIGQAIVRCDWPGCDANRVCGPLYFHGNVDFRERLKQMSEKVSRGWLLRFRLPRDHPTGEEDFCPKHGRCSWCRNRVERERLTPGRGASEGQMICTSCIIEREG